MQESEQFGFATQGKLPALGVLEWLGANFAFSEKTIGADAQLRIPKNAATAACSRRVADPVYAGLEGRQTFIQET